MILVFLAFFMKMTYFLMIYCAVQIRLKLDFIKLFSKSACSVFLKNHNKKLFYFLQPISSNRASFRVDSGKLKLVPASAAMCIHNSLNHIN